MSELLCDVCGGKLVMKSGGVASCEVCGMEHSNDRLREKINSNSASESGASTNDSSPSPNLENAYSNAYSTFFDGNYEEAYRLLTQLLNSEPNNPEAVLYRGCCALALSTFENMRMEEAISAINRAAVLAHNKYDDTALYFIHSKKALFLLTTGIRAKYEMFCKYKDMSMSVSFSANSIILDAFADRVSSFAVAAYSLSNEILGQIKDYAEADEEFYIYLCQAMLDTFYYIENVEIGVDVPSIETLTVIRDNVRKLPIPEQYKDARDLRQKIMRNTVKYNKNWYDGHYEEFMEGYNSFLAEERQIEENILQKYWEDNPSEHAVYQQIEELLIAKVDAEYERNALGAFAFSQKKMLEGKIAELQHKISGLKGGLAIITVREIEQKIILEKNRRKKDLSNTKTKE